MAIDSSPEYGKRLIPQILDRLASIDPDRIVYSVATFSDDSPNFRDITARAFAKAVDKTAWWLHDRVGAQSEMSNGISKEILNENFNGASNGISTGVSNGTSNGVSNGVVNGDLNGNHRKDPKIQPLAYIGPRKSDISIEAAKEVTYYAKTMFGTFCSPMVPSRLGVL